MHLTCADVGKQMNNHERYDQNAKLDAMYQMTCMDVR